MGGLDARYAIARLGVGARVASLVTIGTPHRGSALADFKDTALGAALRRLARGIGLDDGGFDCLTIDAMARFNAEVPDHRGVVYACVLATAHPGKNLNPLLLPTHTYLAHRSGPSDGIVPLDSQRWGEPWLEVDADHYAQVGWSSAFDAHELYAALVRGLQERGL
jgi:triacylglycerol lipase